MLDSYGCRCVYVWCVIEAVSSVSLGLAAGALPACWRPACAGCRGVPCLARGLLLAALAAAHRRAPTPFNPAPRWQAAIRAKAA